MNRLRRCVLRIGLAVLIGAPLLAAPPLTVVQDILFNADGTRFNGTAAISWRTFEASDMSNIPAHSLTTQIVNGLLRVQLVPTANALSPASYAVTYSSPSGPQFTENWSVPPSDVPVRVKDIRISGPGTVVGGGGSTPPPILTSINISDVIGLSSALNLRVPLGSGYTPSRAAVIDAGGALDGAIGNASDCLHVDGTSGPCGTSGGTSGGAPGFVDGEAPSGIANGSNAAFQLANAPNPTSSLMLFRNGLLMKQFADYTVVGAAITFLSAAIPQSSDILQASYRMGAALPSLVFVDGETPGGTVDGSNTVFTVSQAPNPVASLAVYRNGLRLRANLDYTFSGINITFLPGLAPQPGDTLLCSYRH